MYSFFFNDTATTEIYTLSLHDALPISPRRPGVPRGLRPLELQQRGAAGSARAGGPRPGRRPAFHRSEEPRLNSSHANISYSLFCLRKKTNNVRPVNRPFDLADPLPNLH